MWLLQTWRHHAAQNYFARESGHPGARDTVGVQWLWVPAFAGTAVAFYFSISATMR